MIGKNNMSDLEKFKEVVDDIWEIVFGTKRRKSVSDNWPMNIRNMATDTKPKRARTEKGYYKADDLSTAYTNEAWVGGKKPKSKLKKINRSK